MQKSPPRSPHDLKLMYDHAVARAGGVTSEAIDDIVARQNEILERKHDIAIWEVRVLSTSSEDSRLRHPYSAKSRRPERSSPILKNR